MTKSLHSAQEDVRPERVWGVYPGAVSYPIHERVEVVPLTAAIERARSLI